MTIEASLRLSEATKRAVKRPVRGLFRRFGYEIISGDRDPQRAVAGLVRHAGITTILDVGANQGQYGEHMRACGYRERIISFEPGQAAFARLSVAVRGDSRWEARRMALGEKSEKKILHVSANSVSSSLREVGPTHVAAAPGSAVLRSEEVRVERLDSQVPAGPDRLMLKLDTQGYELEILRGGESVLPRIQIVQVELSFDELYLGQAGYLEVLSYLDKHGFRPWQIVPGFTDSASGRILQADVIACRAP